MPYNNEKRQATAVFLNIKRRQGLAAAKKFGRKHAVELSAERKGYKPRSRRV
jgi:hypothetical protein